MSIMNPVRVFHKLFLGLLLLLVCPTLSFGAATAGYSEYYIPGSEDSMSLALRSLGGVPASNNTHAMITITAWSDNVTVYYDHWENGLTFDPDNPAATADETFTLAITGTLLTLDNTPGGGIVIPRNSANTYYDGGDRIYVAGGAVTVTRSSWLEVRGRAVQAVSWEIYPVKPQLTTYVLPFGENLSGAFPDFLRSYVVIQATADNTTFTVDLDGNGTPDPLDQNFDGDTADPGDTTVVTLQAGESFFIGNVPVNPVPMPLGARATINSGAVIQGSSTLQVKYIVGDPAATYETRGISAFPRGYWTKEYYAPVGEPANGTVTDIFLYNPNASAITVDWETLAGSGSFTINAGATVSYRVAAGALPIGGGVYLRGSDVFWGVSTIDSTGPTNEWAYSLLPTTLLYDEHFLGAAPGGADGNDSGVFLTVVQDNTRVFVDTDNDGIADQTFTLNRLQSQYITDPTDGDLSGARFWATGKFSMAYGQNPDTAPAQATSGDLGYVAIPGADFISLVLTVDKSVNPQVVSTASGSTAIFTLNVNSRKYTVDDVMVLDILPVNWQYLGPTAITLPDMSTVTTAPAVTAAGAALPAPFTGNCPAGGGACLTWDNAVLGNMDENQQIVISFTAQTTAVLAAGTLSQNRVKAIGYRTVGDVPFVATQTFEATDFAYVASGALQITKTSGAADPVSPGDTIPYTVTVTNPAGSPMQTGVSLFDALPDGLTYVAGSGSVTCNIALNVRDEFGAVAYNNNGPNNTNNWAGNWTETDAYGTGPGVSGANANGGYVWITGGQLQFRYLLSTVSDDFSTNASYADDDGSNNWNAAWAETNDAPNGSAANGYIVVTGGYARFRGGAGVPPAPANRSISRTATVTGATSATINFNVTDNGIDGGETMVAEYSIDGGVYVTIGTLDGAAGWTWGAGGPVPLTIPLLGNNTLTLRFRAPQVWSSTANDEARVLDASISFNAPANAVGSLIKRTANLTGATGAALNFSYSSANLAAGDTFVVEASNAAGGPFTPLATFTGGVPDVAPPYDLTAYMTANTTIQFRVLGGFNAVGQVLNIENVDISYVVPPASVIASGSAPNFLSSTSGCAISGGGSLTLTFNATVDNPFPAGQTSLTNTASVSSLQMPIAITASATNNVLVPSALSASAGGRVWLDADADGVQDIGEPGMPNIEVTLKDLFGTPVATTLTDGNGRFLFTGIEAGTGYYVEVTDGLSAGLSQTFPVPPGLNKTTSFDLLDGQVYSTADLGYRASAGTASFGDQVWVDANADGIRSAGEIGLGGVTIKLYRDRNSDGLLASLTDLPDGIGTVSASSGSSAVVGSGTAFAAANAGDAIIIQGVSYTIQSVTDSTHLILTTNYTGVTGGGKAYMMPIATVSNPDGTYLFTGAPASGTETYFVSADTPTGYLTTGTLTHRFWNVATGSTLLSADFGFNSTSTTFIIKDRVWTDTNGNQVFDAGENGIGGVTIELLDASLNVIGTTSTAPDGTFTFTGLAGGGADYTVRINDTGGALADYYGTTPYALALKRAESNLTSSIDRTLLPSPPNPQPSYGFRPLRSIGDTVFNDMGGTNGVQDAGEPGLAGVVVSLFKDINGDGSLTVTAGPGTVTATNGSAAVVGSAATIFTNYRPGDPITIAGVMYTIQSITNNQNLTLTTNYTGVTAAGLAYSGPPQGTGTVNVTLGSAAVVGSALTTFTSYRAGDPITINNGGTVNVVYTILSITDDTHLTLTANYAGTTNAARTYYGPGDALIGSVTTDANGQYLFSGLIDRDYIVSVADPVGYNFVQNSVTPNPDTDATTSGIQNRAAMVGGVNVLDKDFGFRAPVQRTIAGTIWDDTDADGVIDGGEARLSGVTIDLLRWNTVVAGTTSAADGSYTFSGLTTTATTGPGTVFATNGSAAVVGTGTSFTTALVAGQPITINGVGYTIASIADDTHLTLTANYLGATAGGLAYMATSYTVRVTDFNGVLTGYNPTFEYEVGMAGPFDSQAPVSVIGGDGGNVNFGFREPTPTLVTLSGFSAYNDGGKVAVQWSTSSEMDTVGFYLYRLDESTGKYRQINRDLLPGLITSQQGGTYSLIDRGASLKDRNTYVLVEVEGKGARNAYGPFTIMAGGGDAVESRYSSGPASPAKFLNDRSDRTPGRPVTSSSGRITRYTDSDGTIVITNGKGSGRASRPQGNLAADEVSDYVRKAGDVSAVTAARIDTRKEAEVKARYLIKERQGRMVKLSVGKEGLYYVDAAEISALMGLSQNQAKQMIQTARLALSSQGKTVAYVPTENDSGIFFYGQGIDSRYTKENVYWLYRGRGLQMGSLEGDGPAPSGYSAFTESMHFEQDNVAAPSLANGPDSDYWFWDYVISGNPSMGAKTFSLQTYGVANESTQAVITVRLHGLTDTGVAAEHHAVISLNGTPIGEDRWQGAAERDVRLSFSQGLLYDGTNMIEVKGLLDTGAPYSIFYVDSFDLTYKRLYEAVGNALVFRGESPVFTTSPVTITGFTDPGIFVFDITDPDRPIVNLATTLSGPAGNFSVSFIASAGARYLATTSNAASTDLKALADLPSKLASRNNAADYIVITSPELAAAAGELARYREGQGLKTMVVDLEDIMDEFNYGIHSPQAINDFLIYAYYNWEKAPRYVVLVGEGTYDYKNALGIGDNIVPTLMTATPQVISASDTLFGDVDGDHVPDIAIGRLSVLTAAELKDVLSKIIAYENAADNRIIMLADNPDEGGDFPAGSDELASLIPGIFATSKIYLSQHTLADTRSLLMNGLNTGAGLLNYIGHSGLDRFAQEGLLMTADVAHMTNAARYPLVTAFTCAVGQFSIPGYDSMSEALLVKKDAGAVAIWSATGYTFDSLSKVLGRQFFNYLFAPGVKRLGDVVLKAMRAAAFENIPGYVLDIYNLQGDPALKLGY